MNALTGIVATTFLAIVVWLSLRWIRERKFQRLASEILARPYVEMLSAQVPLYAGMPANLQRRLQGLVNVFLNDKNFFGSAGLEVTDQMRITVAGNACLLLLNRENPRFPGSRTIILYPDTYIATETTRDGLLVREGHSVRLGESWHRGPVILSWSDIVDGISDPTDGQNVIIHEFAHKLDEENVAMDGLPILNAAEDYTDWARVMTQEFAGLTARAEKRANKVLNAYGTVSPPEFFAVASEAFFERGKKMQKHLPELYAQLQRFYGVDPATWKGR